MTLNSLWMARAPLPHFPRLRNDLTVDVAVIGAGITGVTAAYLLKQAGLRVALLERNRCGRVDTGHTTAHLTYVTDLRLHDLVARFGRDHARAAWEAGDAAMRQIEDLVRTLAIACEFRCVPGYLHAPLDGTNRGQAKRLSDEAHLAADLGFDAAFEDQVPLIHRPGIRFANQAKFHPLEYLAGLLRRLPGRRCHVFEETEVQEVTDEPAVRANGKTVHCRWVVISTHVPLLGKTSLMSGTLFQSKLASYSTCAVAARIPTDWRAEASFWDTADPYHYLRIDRGPRFDVAILGGEDHKTGQQTDSQERFARLDRLLQRLIPAPPTQGKTVELPNHRWSGQVVDTPDGLPYIGPSAPHQFIATGFGGNGMTFGTLAAMMACDAVQRRKNPWSDLFSVERKPLHGAWNYLRENLDYPYYLIKDRLAAAEGSTLKSVHRGEGKILKIKGKRVAVYRQPNGKVTKLSPFCTHLGCLVAWNGPEATWDCPCHGSRFGPAGDVIAGPAETPLPKHDK